MLRHVIHEYSICAWSLQIKFLHVLHVVETFFNASFCFFWPSPAIYSIQSRQRFRLPRSACCATGRWLTSVPNIIPIFNCIDFCSPFLGREAMNGCVKSQPCSSRSRTMIANSFLVPRFGLAPILCLHWFVPCPICSKMTQSSTFGISACMSTILL